MHPSARSTNNKQEQEEQATAMKNKHDDSVDHRLSYRYSDDRCPDAAPNLGMLVLNQMPLIRTSTQHDVTRHSTSPGHDCDRKEAPGPATRAVVMADAEGSSCLPLVNDVPSHRVVVPGALAIQGLDYVAGDDDRTVQIGDDSGSELGDSRAVETQAGTVVAQPITDDELRDQFREELRGELQEEMEANAVHGEVLSEADEGRTKRRLWIAGVVLLVIIGIVVSVVVVVTGTKSDPSDGSCVTDTDSLYADNPSLQSAVNAYQAEIDNRSTDLSCTTSGSATTCTLTPTMLNSLPALRDACNVTGAQGLSTGGSLYCTGMMNGQNRTYTTIFVDIYYCVAHSCTQAEVDEHFDRDYTGGSQEFEQLLEDHWGTEWFCTV